MIDISGKRGDNPRGQVCWTEKMDLGAKAALHKNPKLETKGD